jgi:succinyl-CoA synthetase alpha subunit
VLFDTPDPQAPGVLTADELRRRLERAATEMRQGLQIMRGALAALAASPALEVAESEATRARAAALVAVERELVTVFAVREHVSAVADGARVVRYDRSARIRWCPWCSGVLIPDRATCPDCGARPRP